MLSPYGSHPTPEGFAIISPAQMTKIGPFPNENALTAVIEELVKHSVFFGVVITTMISERAPEVGEILDPFFDEVTEWRKSYLPLP